MRRKESCRHCGGWVVDIIRHEENCIMRNDDRLPALGIAMQTAEARQAQAAEYLADCLCDEARLLDLDKAKLRYQNAREAHERVKADYEKAYRQGKTDAILPVTKEERKMIATGEVPARSVSDIRRLAKAYEVRLTVIEEENKRLRNALGRAINSPNASIGTHTIKA